MLWSNDRWNMVRRCILKSALIAAMASLPAMVAPAVASAQEAQQAPSGQAAQGGAPQGGQNVVGPSWVKLCQTNEKTQKEICRIELPVINGSNGMLLMTAAVYKMEGEEKERLVIKLPVAISLVVAQGVVIAVDDSEPMGLRYTICVAGMCQAEAEMTPELLEKFRKGKELAVRPLTLQSQERVPFAISLEGFSNAYDGDPVDSEKYFAALKQQVDEIRARQSELANKAAEAEQKKQGGAGGTPSAEAATARPKTAIPVQ